MSHETETTTDPRTDPEILARYWLHKAKREKAGGQALDFDSWLIFYLNGRSGGRASSAARHANNPTPQAA